MNPNKNLQITDLTNVKESITAQSCIFGQQTALCYITANQRRKACHYL